ncbi:MAG: flagellar biogenesis protein [Tissierellia bacterium]|nr:flagellar biogenesis protein [Tissierellia bacterium]
MKKEKKNLIKKAVALTYKEQHTIPKIIGKGKGKIADKLLEIGEKEGIEIYEDKELVEDLYRLDINEAIPPELYEAVSRIIVFIYYLDKEKGGSYEK